MKLKKYIQGTNSDGKETRTQINSLEQKEERNIQPEQNEETRIQKNEERLRNLWDNFKHSNIQIIEVPDGEKGTLVHRWWECRLVRPLWKTVWNFLRKTKNGTAF